MADNRLAEALQDAPTAYAVGYRAALDGAYRSLEYVLTIGANPADLLAVFADQLDQIPPYPTPETPT